MEKHKVVVFSDATGSIDGHYKVDKRKGCEGGKTNQLRFSFSNDLSFVGDMQGR